MPTTAIIRLRALGSGKIRRSFHCLMHPVLLAKVASVSPSVSVNQHDSLMMNAFSLSPVMGVRKDTLLENQAVWVRVGLLSEPLEDAFVNTLEKGLWREPVRLGDFDFAVESVALGKQKKAPWSGGESFVELSRRSTPSARAGLIIESPLAFKRGDLHYPLPDPALIFGNLLRRWNLVAPFKLPEVPVGDAVSYSFVDIRTAPYSLRKGGTIFGSTGKLVFIFKGEAAVLSYFNLLLNFAFYAGIGVKTSQGMGMCRIFHPQNGNNR